MEKDGTDVTAQTDGAAGAEAAGPARAETARTPHAETSGTAQPETAGTDQAPAKATAGTEAGASATAGTRTNATAGTRTKLVSGPGIVLVWLYGVMTVGAASRSVYQIASDFDRAPLAYSLSAVAAVVYVFITYTLVRGGETARKVALVCCAFELVGVLTVGTWTLVDSSAFPDATVWSYYGAGYILIPVALPITGILWLRRSRALAAPAPSA